jgi:ATP-binding cassette subfamily C (CFTR/MRP) protein 1
MLTGCTAKRLPFADYIVALDGNGRISEHGSFTELNATGGYVSSFTLPPPEWDYRPEQNGLSAGTPVSHYVYCAPVPDATAQAAEADSSRRTGDVSIYLYYVSSVGWIPTIIFIVTITSFVFCITFPSKNFRLFIKSEFIAESRRQISG